LPTTTASSTSSSSAGTASSSSVPASSLGISGSFTTITAALSSTSSSSSSSTNTQIPITPSAYSTFSPGSSYSATATYVSQEAPAPACTQPACPNVNNVTCTDADGKAYSHQCDTGVSGGTVIVMANTDNSRRDAELMMFDDMMMTMYSEEDAEVGLKKRQTDAQQAQFQQCQLQCDSVSYCRAVAYNTTDSTCHMFAQISGTGYAPGVLFAERAPAQDASSSASTGGAITSTIYSTDITTVTSCPPDVVSCPASSTVVSTSLVPVSVTVSSSTATATAANYSSYCGGYYEDAQTPPNNYSVDCTSDYVNASITTVTSVRDLYVCVNTCSQVSGCLAATWLQNTLECRLHNANDLSSTTPFAPGVVGYRATRLTSPNGPLTITIYSTDISTVTSCAPDVTSCPARSTVVSTTLIPISVSVVSSTAAASSTSSTAAAASSTSSAAVAVSSSSSAPAFVTSTIYSTALSTVISSSSTLISTTLIPVGTSVITENSSSAAASSISSSAVGVVTSTIYSTALSTITSSSSTVVSTSLVPISVTISTVSLPSATSSSAVGVVTSTIYSTDITTITSCSPGVVSCPASSTVVSTSLVPISVSVSTVYTEFSTSWYSTWSGTPFSTASSTAYSSAYSSGFSSAFSSAYSSACSSAFSSAFSTANSMAFSSAASMATSFAASSAASFAASSAASSVASSAASSAASSFASSAVSSGAASYASSTAGSGVASTFTPSGATDSRSGSVMPPTSTSTYYTGPITITVRPSTCPALQTLTTTVFTTGYVSSCAPDVVCSSSGM
ncbi:hypothetical protein KCU91_g5092, partial [Aureobasidium melanogenum]